MLGRRIVTHPELSGSSFSRQLVCFFVSLQARRPGPTGRLRDSVVASRYVLLCSILVSEGRELRFSKLFPQCADNSLEARLVFTSHRDVTCCRRRPPLSRETPDRVFSSSQSVVRRAQSELVSQLLTFLYYEIPG